MAFISVARQFEVCYVPARPEAGASLVSLISSKGEMSIYVVSEMGASVGASILEILRTMAGCS